MNTSEEYQSIYDKIYKLEQRVKTLEKQINSLGIKNAHNNAWATEKTPYSKKQEETTHLQIITPAPITTSQDTKSKTNLLHGVEERIGKKLMSILASILIFVSLILFGSMIHSIMTPIIKTIVMLTTAAAISIVGIVRIRKNDKYKTLFTALAACGITAFYIASLVANLWLDTIDIYTLGVIIASWIIAVLTLTRYHKGIFIYISYAGILIASALALIKWELYLPTLLLYTLMVGTLYYIIKSRDYGKDAWIFIAQAFLLPVFSIISDNNSLDYNILNTYCYVALGVGVLFFQLYYYKFANMDQKAAFIMNAVLTLGLSVAHNSVWGIHSDIHQILYFVISSTFIYAYYRKTGEINNIILVFAIIFSLFVDLGLIFNIYILGPAIIAAGILCHNIIMRMGGYYILAVRCFFNNHSVILLDNTNSGLEGFQLYQIYPIIIVLAIIPWIIKYYNKTDKLALTAITIYQIIYLCGDYINFATSGLLCSLISLGMCTQYFRLNPVNGEKENESEYISIFFNAIMIFVISIIVNSESSHLMLFLDMPSTITLTACLSSLLLLALACVNIKHLYETHNKSNIIVIFNCMKLAFVVFIILNRMTDISYVISVAGIMLAICFIIYGFIKEIKMIRMFGLAMSMICVIKLVLMDIKYDTTVMRPGGFLAAGLLCYVISYIYTRLEKNNKKDA